ncbi:hypothetical protein DL95DRAFT_472165 [Leptodontidium sp. 2 PMI_412]|nr:hypothetical protein DL95DRAFT_472165 [Leptodontidium sp. 2 PMI_412]
MAPISLSPDALQSTTSEQSDRHNELAVPFGQDHAAGKGVVMAEVHPANKQELGFEGEEVLPHIEVEKPYLDYSHLSTTGAYSGDDTSSEVCISESFELVNITHSPSTPSSGYAVVRRPHPTSTSTENPPSPLLCGDDARMVLEEYLAPVYNMQKVMDGLYLKQSYRKCFTLHPNAFDQVFVAETRTRVVLSSRKYPLAERHTALRDLSKCLLGCFEVAMCTPNIGAETPIDCLMISEIIQALKTEGDLLGRYAETDLTHFARMVLTGYFRSGGDVDSFYEWASCILPTGDNKEDADEDYDEEDRERQDGIPRFE